MRQKFITKCIRFSITKCDSFIKNCNNYYQLRRFYRKNATIVTKYNVCYKLRQYIGMVILLYVIAIRYRKLIWKVVWMEYSWVIWKIKTAVFFMFNSCILQASLSTDISSFYYSDINLSDIN